MKIHILLSLLIVLSSSVSFATEPLPNKKTGKTVITIEKDKFYINGEPTYKGRTWQGHSIEGLLMNSRMVQGVFDDLNPETVNRWKNPDTQKWDADRNTDEFIAAMDDWYAKGLLAFNINFQGGSPEGYSRNQPWENNAYKPDGTLRSAFVKRMARIIEKADDLGMVVNLGLFYFGQDERLKDEQAVISAVENSVNWIKKMGYTNIILEVANESNNKAYKYEILGQERIHELIIMQRRKPRIFWCLPVLTAIPYLRTRL